MTIKDIIYSVHQDLEQITNISVKRSHIYEVLAAAYSFKTYASLASQAILIQRKYLDSVQTINIEQIQKRFEELGYNSILTKELPLIIRDRRIGALTLEDLVNELKNEDFSIDYDWEHENSSQQLNPEVFQVLETAAKIGNPLSHYALALHHQNSDEIDNDETINDYWYKQKQLGRELNDIEKEFARAYQQKLTSKNKYQFHLREAARLGCDLAQLDLAEKFDDPTFFEGNHQNIDADPMKIAEIAESIGRPAHHHTWLTIAAEAGNVRAMRKLIESHDSNDLTRCWTWVYLSQSLDHDLTQDRYYRMHDDGSEYDDDSGGTLHVGGEGGVELPLLEPSNDLLARSAAEKLFKLIQAPHK